MLVLCTRVCAAAGDVFPIHGTCLGFQLLHILEANVSFEALLVDTDSGALLLRLALLGRWRRRWR